jgi:hypothetical protein
MDLNKVFDGIGKQMLLDFEEIQSQVRHAGERGGEREASLRTFLQVYLPSKYAVTNGEIVDKLRQTSKQCDLVIYDHLNCPLLLAGKDYRVFPVEPVLATIEVKSVLSTTELQDASEKIKSVKALDRQNGPIAGIVFAYSSVWQTDPMGNIAKHLKKINQGLEPHQFIDLLCVLDAGVINVVDENGYTRVTKKMSERSMLVWHELTPPILLWFFIQLLDLLDGQNSSPPNYQKYARMFEIGLVSRQELA